MSMIFSFRMLTDEDDHFIRDYEVPYDMTLKDLHLFLCDDLQYDPFEMASFFMSDGSWQKLQEYTLVDMEFDDRPKDEFAADDFLTPISMEKIHLGQIIHNKHDRLLFVFDLFEDRLFFLELIEAKKADTQLQYPRVLLANGEAPDQFDGTKASNNKSIFDEAMDDWGNFDGDENYDDEY